MRMSDFDSAASATVASPTSAFSGAFYRGNFPPGESYAYTTNCTLPGPKSGAVPGGGREAQILFHLIRVPFTLYTSGLEFCYHNTSARGSHFGKKWYQGIMGLDPATRLPNAVIYAQTPQWTIPDPNVSILNTQAFNTPVTVGPGDYYVFNVCEYVYAGPVETATGNFKGSTVRMVRHPAAGVNGANWTDFGDLLWGIDLTTINSALPTANQLEQLIGTTWTLNTTQDAHTYGCPDGMGGNINWGLY